MNEFEEKKYCEIKEELIQSAIDNKVDTYVTNKNELTHYYNVGKMIIDAQGGETRAKYGDGLIKKYSKKLMVEIDKKYSYRNLMYMIKFYLLFSNEKVNPLGSQLSWTHYRELLKFDDINEINYYIHQMIE